MNYEISILDDHAALLVTYNADFDVNSGLSSLFEELIAILDAADTPLTFITDLRNMNVDFGTMVSGLAAGTRNATAMSVTKHPNVAQQVFITDSSLLKIGAKALSQTQYGGLSVMVVDTLEAALASLSVNA